MTKALILGATGAVGKALALDLALHGSYTEITALVRSDITTPAFFASLPNAPSGPPPNTLQVARFDFSSNERVREQAAQLQGYDDIFITLGTTRALAGSAERFLEVDQELPVLIAQLALASGAETKPARQHLLYCSSAGASASSYFLYPRSKGQTEARLSALADSQKATHVTHFRPGMLETLQPRPEGRRKNGEGFFGGVIASFRKVGVTAMSARVDEVAKAMRRCAAGEGPVDKILGNAEILRLAS